MRGCAQGPRAVSGSRSCDGTIWAIHAATWRRRTARPAGSINPSSSRTSYAATSRARWRHVRAHRRRIADHATLGSVSRARGGGRNSVVSRSYANVFPWRTERRASPARWNRISTKGGLWTARCASRSCAPPIRPFRVSVGGRRVSSLPHAPGESRRSGFGARDRSTGAPGRPVQPWPLRRWRLRP